MKNLGFSRHPGVGRGPVLTKHWIPAYAGMTSASTYLRLHIFTLFLILLSFFEAHPVLAFSDKKPFDIAADAVDFIDDTKELIAEGHVVVIQGSSTLKADYLHFDRLNRRLLGRGNVIVRENNGLLTGEHLDYDLATETANLDDPKAYAAPWFFQGGTWEKRNDYYVGRDGSFTSCELPDVHYFFRAKRIHYVPNERFWAWSTWMHVDGLPVLYMPFVQKPLGPQRVTFQAQPGSDSANGTFAKTTTTLRYTDKVYQRMLYDYYSNVGNGFGTELNYKPSSQMKGSFFGYYINPHTAPDVSGAPKEPQYNVRSYHWQRLDPETTLQSNVNLRKNVSFNNLFYRQDDNQGVDDVFSSIALTKQTKKINQRLVIEADQATDPGSDPLFADEHIQSASLPRYEFTLYQIPLWAPKHAPLLPGSTAYPHVPQKPDRVGALNFTMNGSAQENYLRLDDKTRAKANTQANLSQSYIISRDITITPGLNTQLRWQDLDDPQPSPLTPETTSVLPVPVPILERRGVQGLSGASVGTRMRVTRNATLDQTYQLTYRTTPNEFALDRSQNDGGIDTHHISWVLVQRPSQALLMRSFSGMDLRHLENEDLNTYQQRRIDPWTTELTISPRASPYQLFARYQLGYYPTRDLSWEVSGHFTGIHKTLINSGFLYSRGIEGRITWNNTVGFYFSPGWRLDGSVNMYIPTLNSDRTLGQVGKVIDNELFVTRDIHCWQIQFIVRNRPPIAREYSILANLKFGPQTPKKIEDNDLESQFYPWRAGAWAN